MHTLSRKVGTLVNDDIANTTRKCHIFIDYKMLIQIIAVFSFLNEFEYDI